MKQCRTCGIISHPHKDFYKCFDKKVKKGSHVCKYCYPVIRKLKNDGVIPNKKDGVKYFSDYRDMILDKIEERKAISTHKVKNLKFHISNRLAYNYGKLKCTRCKIWHNRKDQPLFMQKHGSRFCHSCHKDLSLEWNKNNKEHANNRSKKYIKKRLKEDTFFKFQYSVRALINCSIKRKNYTKKSKTQEILGCDWDTFKKHIEKQFKKGMSWENRNEWHIDHILPMKEAKTEEDVIRLNHYTNLRPLWAKENLSKNASIEEHQMKLPI